MGTDGPTVGPVREGAVRTRKRKLGPRGSDRGLAAAPQPGQTLVTASLWNWALGPRRELTGHSPHVLRPTLPC